MIQTPDDNPAINETLMAISQHKNGKAPAHEKSFQKSTGLKA